MTVAAAVIVFVCVYPRPLELNVKVEAIWPSAVRTGDVPPRVDPGTFTVHISLNRPAYVHLVVALSSGGLWVKQVGQSGEHVIRIEGATEFTYDLWDDPADEPDDRLFLSTHVLVVATNTPIVDYLNDGIAKSIQPGSSEEVMRQLREIARKLHEEFECAVVVSPIEPVSP